MLEGSAVSRPIALDIGVGIERAGIVRERGGGTKAIER